MQQWGLLAVSHALLELLKGCRQHAWGDIAPAHGSKEQMAAAAPTPVPVEAKGLGEHLPIWGILESWDMGHTARHTPFQTASLKSDTHLHTTKARAPLLQDMPPKSTQQKHKAGLLLDLFPPISFPSFFPTKTTTTKKKTTTQK